MRYHVISTVGDLRFERTLEWNVASTAERDQAQAIIERDFPPCNSVPLPDVKTETTVVTNPPNMREFARAVMREQLLDRKTKFGCAT